jgi:hypothetical protein
MADEALLALLKRNTEEWGAWLAARPGAVADLRGADLRGGHVHREVHWNGRLARR